MAFREGSVCPGVCRLRCEGDGASALATPPPNANACRHAAVRPASAHRIDASPHWCNEARRIDLEAARESKLNIREPKLWPPGKAPEENLCGEDERLVVLASFDADELSGDAELARITRFAAKLCGTGASAVSLVDAERQVFIARTGVEETETPRSTSFCAHTMLGGEILEVLDATGDERFAHFSLVRGDKHLRYYAGVPLVSAEGAPLGALCVLDDTPHERPLDELQREGLWVLAEAVKRRLHAHRHANTASSQIAETTDNLQFVLDSMPDIAWSAGPDGDFRYFNARFTEITGETPPRTVEEWGKVIHPDDYVTTADKFREAVSSASVFEDEWRLRTADGSYRYVLSRAVPSSDEPRTTSWFGTLTDIDDSYRLSQEREMLAGELAHRIKNIFSVITGLVTLHARGDATLGIFAKTLTDNIRALSRAQEFALRIDTHSEDELQGLLNVLMAPYGIPGHSAVSVTGDDVQVGPKSATPLALIFHELATNSAKYGALSNAEGTVAVNVACDDQHVTIHWRETGGPDTRAPEGQGFGSRLVRMAVENQLGGTIVQDWKPEGLSITIEVPRERLSQ